MPLQSTLEVATFNVNGGADTRKRNPSARARELGRHLAGLDVVFVQENFNWPDRRGHTALWKRYASHGTEMSTVTWPSHVGTRDELFTSLFTTLTWSRDAWAEIFPPPTGFENHPECIDKGLVWGYFNLGTRGVTLASGHLHKHNRLSPNFDAFHEVFRPTWEILDNWLAGMTRRGDPVIFGCDFNVDPLLLPSLLPKALGGPSPLYKRGGFSLLGPTRPDGTSTDEIIAFNVDFDRVEMVGVPSDHHLCKATVALPFEFDLETAQGPDLFGMDRWPWMPIITTADMKDSMYL